VEGEEAAIFILFMDCILNDFSGIFMEVFERYGRYDTSYTGRDTFASITNEIMD
jgi:hypothetical protein